MYLAHRDEIFAAIRKDQPVDMIGGEPVPPWWIKSKWFGPRGTEIALYRDRVLMDVHPERQWVIWNEEPVVTAFIVHDPNISQDEIDQIVAQRIEIA